MNTWAPVIAAIIPLIVAATAWLKASAAHKRATETAQAVADHMNTAHGQ